MKLIELDKLFTVSYGNKLDLYKMSTISKSNTHSVAFIARTKQNNGIVAYVEKIANVAPHQKGAITVALGGSVLSSFVQYDDFYTAQNVAVLTPICEMSEQMKMFYCVAIMENAFRYSTCGREANKTLKSLMLPDISALPMFVKDKPVPDYSDMILPAKKGVFEIDVSKWKPFIYDELFVIERGTGPRKQDISFGEIPFVTSTDTNNGVSAFCDHIPTHSGNTITVNRNGSVAEAFYQENAFCSTEDVHVFNPKFDLNKHIAFFFIALFRKEKYRYSYGRKWGMDRMNNSIIKLPVTPSGNPDYAFMERYIKSLPYSSAI